MASRHATARRIAQMMVQPNTPEGAIDLPRIIFSSVDAPIARELEPLFAAAGCAVISNSSAFRMGADVPLVVPEVNADHFEVIESQPTRKRTGGFLVTNPNCCAIGLVLPLARAARALRHRKTFRLDHAGCLRSGLSRRPLARHPRQRDPLHQERRREAAGRGRQAARRAQRLPASSQPTSRYLRCATASLCSKATPSASA